jgi:hypothetical protein
MKSLMSCVDILHGVSAADVVSSYHFCTSLHSQHKLLTPPVYYATVHMMDDGTRSVGLGLFSELFQNTHRGRVGTLAALYGCVYACCNL